MNWWVKEVSDYIHWDADGLSIIDPRQMAHLIELAEPLREYNFDEGIMDRAFIAFKIQKDLGDGIVRLIRTKESLFDTDEPLFALPDVIDEVNGPYADLMDHLTRLRVNMLNDIINFEQNLTIDELEEELREEENNNFIEGGSVHMFTELTNILDYVPAGWELDRDDAAETPEEEKIEDFPEIDDEEAKKISESENLKWDEDEKEETSDDSYEGGPPDEQGKKEELPAAEEK